MNKTLLLVSPLLFASPLLAGGRPRVLVELFTSQGCSSCPPADRVLSTWGMEAFDRGDILPLAFHVNYWNYIGWKDPFSSKAFTKRQNDYAGAFGVESIYTPQLIVGGEAQFNGADDGRLAREVSARKDRDDGLQLALTDGRAAGRAAATGTLPAGIVNRRPRLVRVVFENGLSTRVTRGENGGRDLVNDFVVKQLDDLGVVKPDAQGRFHVDIAAAPAPGRVGVFLQDPKTMKVFGAAVTE